jgi:hypothetical protein
MARRDRRRDPMKTYYFIGGPVPGHERDFFRELAAIGGPPADWRIYPHADEDARALHVVDAESDASIVAHLRRFDGIYAHGPIVQIVTTPGTAGRGEVHWP